MTVPFTARPILPTVLKMPNIELCEYTLRICIVYMGDNNSVYMYLYYLRLNYLYACLLMHEYSA